MSESDDRKDLTDHDLLIRIDERVRKLGTCLATHLTRHWIITLAAITAGLGALGTLAVAIVLLKMNSGGQ